MPTTIIVVRHANTFEGNNQPTRIGNRTDIPLVQAGIEQCILAGQYLKTKGYLPAAVYSSPLSRARQTAEQILKEMRLEREIHIERMFNEIDYGPDEHQPENVIMERLGGPAAINEWNRHGTLPPDWEGDVDSMKQHWIDFAHHVDVSHPHKATLVVTHSGVARFSLAITNEFDRMARNHGLKTSMGGICIFEKEDASDKWKVKEWNTRPKSATSGLSSARSRF